MLSCIKNTPPPRIPHPQPSRPTVVDDVVKQRDVDASRRHVGDHQQPNLACTELGDVDLTGRLRGRKKGGEERRAGRKEGQKGERG
jgi:hypothetical protein